MRLCNEGIVHIDQILSSTLHDADNEVHVLRESQHQVAAAQVHEPTRYVKRDIEHSLETRFFSAFTALYVRKTLGETSSDAIETATSFMKRIEEGSGPCTVSDAL